MGVRVNQMWSTRCACPFGWARSRRSQADRRAALQGLKEPERGWCPKTKSSGEAECSPYAGKRCDELCFVCTETARSTMATNATDMLGEAPRLPPRNAYTSIYNHSYKSTNMNKRVRAKPTCLCTEQCSNMYKRYNYAPQPMLRGRLNRVSGS
jgi:hypothetical protein